LPKYSLALVYIWFGALKVLGVNSAAPACVELSNFSQTTIGLGSRGDFNREFYYLANKTQSWE